MALHYLVQRGEIFLLDGRFVSVMVLLFHEHIPEIQRAFPIQDQLALDHVFQFPDISRPAIGR